MGQMIDFSRPDGRKTKGYFAQAGAGRPGIVVIQEWWGLNDQICGVADRFARAGYNALAPDLYEGRVTQKPDEANHLMTGLDFPGAAHQDIRGAVQYLVAQGGKVGVMGFCMGGALTLLSAVHVPELDASVVWYGYPPLEYVDASKIQKPLQGHWALHDEFFPIAGVDQLEVNLKAANTPYTFYRYDAKHAFTNPEADARHLPPLQYNEAATKEAWQRTHAFLKTHLG